MKEQVLLDYFEGSVDKLADEVKDSQKRTSYDATTVYIHKIENDKFFEVKAMDSLQTKPLSTKSNFLESASRRSMKYNFAGMSRFAEAVVVPLPRELSLKTIIIIIHN